MVSYVSLIQNFEAIDGLHIIYITRFDNLLLMFMERGKRERETKERD
jgi:hypothetical protein